VPFTDPYGQLTPHDPQYPRKSTSKYLTSTAVFYTFANKIDIDSGEDPYIEKDDEALRIRDGVEEVEFDREGLVVD
jgi:hypothetical protein